MIPQLMGVDAQDPPPDRRFRRREFRSILALAWPYRAKLAAGFVCTVIYALCHTASIGGAFPIFKMLLEPEGLSGWVNRSIAGDRLGVDFAQPTDQETTLVSKVHGTSTASADGLNRLDVVADPDGHPLTQLFAKLARAEAGTAVSVVVDPNGTRRVVQVTPGPLRLPSRMMRWVATFVPADAGTNAGRLRVLKYLLGALILLVVVANLFRYLGEVLIATAILRAMMRLRAHLYERTLHLPMSFFAGQPTADLVTRFVQDVQEIQRGLVTIFGKFVREPLRVVFILGLALVLDWRITLTMVVVVPLTVALFWAIGRSVKKANRKLLQGYGAMIGALTTSLQNLRVVKSFTAEGQERKRLTAVDLRMFTQQVKLAKLRAFVGPTIESIAVMAGSFATVWLAGRVLAQELSLTKFVQLGFTLGVLFDPLRKLTDVYVRVQRATAGAERIFHVLEQPVEDDPPDARMELKPLERCIEYADVTFTYPGANEPALREINLSLHRGETVAIVGPNGCGKTTLVSMLLRLYVPDSGKILFDGVDIRRVGLMSLRSQIGLVSQDAVIFDGTPIENIAYGEANVDEDRAKDAAGRAYADEFIRNIPGGYQASIGERGTTLSGGQRQRLAIARAIYRNAPILIFDEATSQIDTESEQKIQTALKDFSRGRTTLIIAHRLSTIQFADRIVIMDRGRVMDSGSHRELFDRCPLYRSLCETQFVTEPVSA